MMGSILGSVSPRDRRVRGLSVGMLLVCTMILTPPFRGTPASASFPGENGRIAFVLEQNGFGDIYTMDPDGANRQRLSTIATYDDRNPAFSPDGTKIAFESNRDGNLEIYVMKSNGFGVTRLTNSPGSDTDPSWSPDGSTIVFSSQRDPNAELYTVPAGGGTNTRLTNTPDGEHSPAWSPDGSKIVYENNGPDGIQIYSIPAAGGTPTRLTQDDTGGRSPNWTSDGLIIFNRALEIWVMEANGAGARLLAAHGRIGLAAAAPDGAGYIFSSDASDGSNDDIWMVPSGGGAPQRLTTDPLDELEPDWGTLGPPGPDLVVSQTGPSDPVEMNTNYPYTITVTNAGPFTATNVTAIHNVEGGANTWYTNAAAFPGACAWNQTNNGPVMRCLIGSLAPGQSVTGTIKVRANYVGTWTGTASVSYNEVGDEATLYNNSVEVETTILKGQTSTTVKVEVLRGGDIVVSGSLTPAQATEHITVTLKDPEGRRSKQVPTSGGGGRYETVFHNRGGRNCSVQAKFLGNHNYWPSRDGKEFSCAGGNRGD